jgi:hypothetical protein
VNRLAIGAWLVAACSGCASNEQLLADLRSAANQQGLPQVVACWERSYEDAGFFGSYIAVVDFRVEAGSGNISDAEVRELLTLHDDDSEMPTDSAALARCLERALDASSLGSAGYEPPQTVVVHGYRMAFTDASGGERADASEQTPHTLIGPRADRCQGLYGHEPPRETTVLMQALSEAQGTAQAYADDDRDRHARALQESYDLALELAARLERELLRYDLSREAKERIQAELREVRDTMKQLGKAIGCARR